MHIAMKQYRLVFGWQKLKSCPKESGQALQPFRVRAAGTLPFDRFPGLPLDEGTPITIQGRHRERSRARVQLSHRVAETRDDAEPLALHYPWPYLHHRKTREMRHDQIRP